MGKWPPLQTPEPRVSEASHFLRLLWPRYYTFFKPPWRDSPERSASPRVRWILPQRHPRPGRAWGLQRRQQASRS